ncbi:MAG: amidase, partial [Acidimicrobiia bacterium]
HHYYYQRRMSESGVSMAADVAGGTASAAALATAALEAADADTTNAFTALDETALDRAEDLDSALAAGAQPGLLMGVPIAVKDIVDHVGRTTTAGSAFYRHEAEATAPALERLEAAGAVVVGRTGLHEFAFGFSSENPWFGPVLNPWDHQLSPGGSSGGSAAAVAAGIVPIAVGTDTGGSVRVPAALCAVVGLKVTHGLIPLDGVFPLVPSLDTVGAIAASLDDLAVATWIMAGVPPRSSRGVETVIDGLRLVVPRRWVDSSPISQEVESAFEGFLLGAMEAGIGIASADLPALGPSPLQGVIIGPEVAAIHRSWRLDGLPYGEDVGERIDNALSVDDTAAEDARRWQQALAESITAVTDDGALLVTPTVAAMDKTIGQDMIGAHHHRTVLSWFTAPVNTAGCPALTMPVKGPGRQPSIQLIGAPGSEAQLLATAGVMEQRGLLGVNP